jgi:hypothetical protein
MQTPAQQRSQLEFGGRSCVLVQVGGTAHTSPLHAFPSAHLEPSGSPIQVSSSGFRDFVLPLHFFPFLHFLVFLALLSFFFASVRPTNPASPAPNSAPRAARREPLAAMKRVNTSKSSRFTDQSSNGGHWQVGFPELFVPYHHVTLPPG